MRSPNEHPTARRTDSTVTLPAPTAWPIVLAFGVTLLFAGLITSLSVMILGAILAVSGCVGWFLDVFPHEKHVQIPDAGGTTLDHYTTPRSRGWRSPRNFTARFFLSKLILSPPASKVA